MSITVNDVFAAAMVLVGCTDADGSVHDSGDVRLFRGRAPGLCDMAQRELVCFAKYRKTAVFDFSDDGGASVNVSANVKFFALPSDYLFAERLSADGIDVTGQPYPLRIVGEKIYADGTFDGIAEILYNAAPAAVTSFGSQFCFSDADVLSSLPYYLAAAYIREENPSLAAEFRASFETAKARIGLSTSQNGFTEIADCIGTECGGDV